MKLMLDLYSGLGGASEAFVLDNDWSVLRYDNNPELRNVPLTTICDLKNYEIKCRHQIDLIWASPPCQDFSNAYDAPKPRALRAGEVFEPDMSHLERAIEIIEELKPTHWIIENVAGAIKDFKPYLGEPRQIIGPYILWGNFPLLTFFHDRKWKKEFNHTNSRTPLRSNIHAKIPLELSDGLLTALQSQTTINEWS